MKSVPLSLVIGLSETPNAFISSGIKEVLFPIKARRITRVRTNLFIDVPFPIFVSIEFELIIRFFDICINVFQGRRPTVVLEGELDFA